MNWFSLLPVNLKGSEEDPITGQEFMDLFRSEMDNKGRWSEPEPWATRFAQKTTKEELALTAKGARCTSPAV